MILFFDSLSMYLRVGYDLSYCWSGTLENQSFKLIRPFLCAKEGEGILNLLMRLTEQYPQETFRVWFSILHELYSSGAPINDSIEAISKNLRDEHERDLERHGRTLPTKINILLLLFFLPPTLILLFTPLMIQLLNL